MKLVIGLVGPPLAGKETVANELETLFKKDGRTVSRHRFSDILRETLTLWDIPHGRTNEQLLPQIMHAPNAFHEGALSRAVKNRLMKDAADVGILDGVRWVEDEKMIRALAQEEIRNLIVYVTASPNDAMRASRRATATTRRRRPGRILSGTKRRKPKWKFPQSAGGRISRSRTNMTISKNYGRMSVPHTKTG